MADTLTTAQKAPLLVDGNPIRYGAITWSVDQTGIINVTVCGNSGTLVFGLAEGTVTLTVSEGNRTGADVITVTGAPLAVTLGSPEPA